MANGSFSGIFSEDVLAKLFPADRADRFFDALFGDAQEGAFDISLVFKDHLEKENELHFELREDILKSG